VIPHTKDPRQFRFSTDLAKHIVTEYDVLGADIIQTFPVAIDRIEHKGFDQVLAIFGYLKRLGKTVKLIVCNSWCNVDQYRDKVRNYQEMAAGHGLLTNTSEKSCELIWTSLVDNSFHELGVSQKVVSDLMSVSNLYIYPTKSESFGLTVAEAAQSGQLLVLNASLAMMREVAGEGNALYFHFGSHSQQAHNTNWEGYYHDIARIIAHRMENNEGLRAKTEFQRKYRREAIWRRIESAVVSEIFAIKREKGPVTAAVA
jgi:glycosyltransferase involved in cell wall biosynthesis